MERRSCLTGPAGLGSTDSAGGAGLADASNSCDEDGLELPKRKRCQRHN